MKRNIMILGSTGMAGHMVYYQLSGREDINIITVGFSRKLNSDTLLRDLTNPQTISDLVFQYKPEIIINCVGVLINESRRNAEKTIFLNAYLPHLLSKLTKEYSGRVIHLSTDCVFSGHKGDYLTDDPKDAQDTYGMSKALGELINDKDLTIRTSIIGPELKSEGEGLLHWFLGQKGEIKGFTDSYWSGITTLQLSKYIERAIDTDIIGLIQYSSKRKINKFELLQIFKQVWKKHEIKIIQSPGKKVDKSLIPSNNANLLEIPQYRDMCVELATYMKKSSQLYKQYLCD